MYKIYSQYHTKMKPRFDKIHLKFKLNGKSYRRDDLKEVAYSLVKEGEAYERIAGDFMLDWLDDKDYIFVKTSGTTGKSKRIKIMKDAMVHSAIMTGDAFGLQPGDTALHCLPNHYISGKMMLVRAMILGLEVDLVAPTLQPDFDADKHYNFAAMIPLQLKHSLDNIDCIKTLIVGGAKVSKPLLEEVQLKSTTVYETYGMTETVSHIAIKPLNKTKNNAPTFKTLPGISISTDDRDCLVIQAPFINTDPIVTNDIVNIISKNEFELLGRYDHMINSGGVKVFPEQVESKLQDAIDQRFFITSEEDTDLGQKVIMIVEGDTSTIDKSVFSVLQKHEVPKAIYSIPKFFETETGKLQRQKILDVVFSMVN